MLSVKHIISVSVGFTKPLTSSLPTFYAIYDIPYRRFHMDGPSILRSFYYTRPVAQIENITSTYEEEKKTHRKRKRKEKAKESALSTQHSMHRIIKHCEICLLAFNTFTIHLSHFQQICECEW